MSVAGGLESTDAGVEAFVAMSLLRPGPDTAAARHFKELSEAGRPTIGDLARRLETRPGARASKVQRAIANAPRAMADASRLGLAIVALPASGYPDRLRQIPDPPIVLWTRGSAEVLDAPAVAIVGSRSATPTGISVAARLGRELADAGLVVVSGLARGVDAAAHRGALDGMGHTIAVLGSGADVIYPPEHTSLARQILERGGAIVSELAPGTPPRAGHFPLRNRIISGLARAVVVVEASEKSGSLITAKAALEQGRDVLAVPGNVISGRHRGCHALIKDGARLVETVDDVLEELKWRREAVRSRPRVNSLQLSGLEGTMAVGEPYSLDELAEATGRGVQDLLAELGALELAGRIERRAGSVFVRT
jgi:DNA processing protein